VTRHLMVCISGFSGVGKDESAKRLITKYGAIQTGLVDPAKRHMADLYGFTESQLFGPSRNRNAGDLRYPKTNNPPRFRISSELTPESNQWVDAAVPWWCFDQGDDDQDRVWVRQHDPKYWLSPREALQRYCELMNLMYENSWVRKGIEIHKQIATGRFAYSRMLGLIPTTNSDTPEKVMTVFTDFRHKHEFQEARKAADGTTEPIFIRIKHPKITEPPFNHRSEIEQTEIPDSQFHHIVVNDGTIEALYAKIDDVISHYNW